MDTVHDIQRIISKHQHSDGLIALFPQHQMLGTVSYDFGPNQGHGTLSNVSNRYRMVTSRGHYMNASGYDGKLSSYNDIYSTDLRDSFDGDAGALFVFMKTDAAWAELISRFAIILAADANNQIYVRKSATAGVMHMGYESQSNHKSMPTGGYTTMDWFCIAMMWDRLVNDECTVFQDGVQIDRAVDLSATAWAGVLAANLCIIGASEDDGSDCWDGGLGLVSIYNKIKPDDEMEWLSKP